MELISTKEALDILEHNAPKNPRRQWGVMVRMATNTVAKALAERKTGKWTHLTEGQYCGMYACSACGIGKTFKPIISYDRYCPYCGAKMEVDDEERR